MELGPLHGGGQAGRVRRRADHRGGLLLASRLSAGDGDRPHGRGRLFAGGFFGYLVSEGSPTDDATLRRAMTYGSAVASFKVEQFGTERVQTLTRAEVDARYEAFRAMTAIDDVATLQDH